FIDLKMRLKMAPEKKHQIKKKNTAVKTKLKVKDYDNDPYFLRKDEQSRLFLKKHGFPEELLQKK
ncbi:MAG TPA: hypothetical protein VG890_14345, partial [Puia sp.]|nr:hypothetical protein [Puia sp.]